MYIAIINVQFVFKMGELTTAVEDDEILSHFNEVLAPYVLENQAFNENPSLGTPSSSQDRYIVAKVEESLTKVIEGMSEDEVRIITSLHTYNLLITCSS